MSRRNLLILLGAIAAILATAAPILFYVIDFHNLPRSTNPSDWGSFGSYLGGTLSPVISFLTLIVTILIAVNISRIEKRNHNETVHSPVTPFLVIEDGYFYSSDISANGLTVEKDYYDYVQPTSPAGAFDYLNNRFYLKISNKGLGVATEVVVSFQIDLDELRSALEIEDEKITNKVSPIHKDEDGRSYIVLTTDAEKHFGYKSFLFKILETERSGLGVIDLGKVHKAVIPTQMMGAFQMIQFIRRLDIRDVPFPTMIVTFEYKNIFGKPITSKFRIGLYHTHDYPRYSVFRILQESIQD